MVNLYVRYVFGEKLVPKRVFGDYVTGPMMLELFTGYCQIYKDPTKVPPPVDVLKVGWEAHSRTGKELALKHYEETMAPVKKKFPMPPAELEALHGPAKLAAMSRFDGRPKYGPEDIRKCFGEFPARIARKQ